MTTLAIIGIDRGVLTTGEERFATAKAAAEATGYTPSSREYNDVYWRTAFAPKLIAEDTLVDGANEALADLLMQVDYAVYLSARDAETTWVSTYLWLKANGLSLLPLHLRPAYSKSDQWNANWVQHFITQFRADQVVYVEGDIKVAKYVQGANLFQTGGGFRGIFRHFDTLADAVAALPLTPAPPRLTVADDIALDAPVDDFPF